MRVFGSRPSFSGVSAVWIIGGWIGCLWICGAEALAGHVVGVEFVATPRYSAIVGNFPIDNFFPYVFTDPASPFGQDGALVGRTEMELQTAIVDAVQRTFRRAEIDQPGRMLNVDIRMGPVAPTIGTTHLIGKSFQPSQLFGSAYPTGATFRPDLRPNSVYTNELSVTYADSVATIPQLNSSVRFTSFESVVESIAGTTSHEIAHTLNVWNHDPGTPVNGWYSIMGTGSTGLPLAARLLERRFLDIPDTQFEFPGPPSAGPLIYSVTDTLFNASGTTWISDFDFDGSLDGGDTAIWRANRFQSGTGVKRGDADDDGLTDVRDYALLTAQSEGFGILESSTSSPVLFYDPTTGRLEIDTRGLEVISLRLPTPHVALSLQDPFTGIPAVDWGSAYFAGNQQWYGLGPMDLGDRVNLGNWAMGLGAADFGVAELGTRLAGRLSTTVVILPEPGVFPLICVVFGGGLGALRRAVLVKSAKAENISCGVL